MPFCRVPWGTLPMFQKAHEEGLRGLKRAQAFVNDFLLRKRFKALQKCLETMPAVAGMWIMALLNSREFSQYPGECLDRFSDLVEEQLAMIADLPATLVAKRGMSLEILGDSDVIREIQELLIQWGLPNTSLDWLLKDCDQDQRLLVMVYLTALATSGASVEMVYLTPWLLTDNAGWRKPSAVERQEGEPVTPLTAPEVQALPAPIAEPAPVMETTPPALAAEPVPVVETAPIVLETKPQGWFHGWWAVLASVVILLFLANLGLFWHKSQKETKKIQTKIQETAREAEYRAREKELQAQETLASLGSAWSAVVGNATANHIGRLASVNGGTVFQAGALEENKFFLLTNKVKENGEASCQLHLAEKFISLGGAKYAITFNKASAGVVTDGEELQELLAKNGIQVPLDKAEAMFKRAD